MFNLLPSPVLAESVENASMLNFEYLAVACSPPFLELVLIYRWFAWKITPGLPTERTIRRNSRFKHGCKDFLLVHLAIQLDSARCRDTPVD